MATKKAKRTPKKKPKGTNVDPVTGDKLFFDSVNEIPEEVAQAAGDYEKKLTASNKASASTKAAKLLAIEKMKEAGIESVLIRNGKERLVATETDNLKIEKVQTDSDGKPLPF